MKAGVGVTVIAFLIDNESLRAVLDELTVLLVLHGANLDANGRDKSLDGINAVLQVALGDKLRMLSGNEQDVTESECVQMPGLGDDLVNGEGGAQDSIIAGEAAVAAVIDTLIRNVERCKQPHGFTKVPARNGAAVDSHGLDFLTRLWRE